MAKHQSYRIRILVVPWCYFGSFITTILAESMLSFILIISHPVLTTGVIDGKAIWQILQYVFSRAMHMVTLVEL